MLNFELSGEEMALIDELDTQNRRDSPNGEKWRANLEWNPIDCD